MVLQTGLKTGFCLLVGLCILALMLVGRIPVEDAMASMPHARVVWLQDIGDGKDVFARGDRLRLMGWDSLDGKGERPILQKADAYRRPLMTPDGSSVVYSIGNGESVQVVGWGGKGPRSLGTGVAVAVWRDPRTGKQWVYVAQDPRASDSVNERFGRIIRFPIDKPGAVEAVWNRSIVGIENFQLSRDGEYAGGTFPWPMVGIAQVAQQRFDVYGKGCWTSLSPDNSVVLAFFDGMHRHWWMRSPTHESPWKVNIALAPGVDGHEVYHPRWSNHPLYFVLTGPYRHQAGPNAIRGGGSQVEVHLGKFSKDLMNVESWMRVTHNERGDFYPDAWLEHGEGYDLDGRTIGGRSVENRPAAKPLDRRSVEATLVEMSGIPDPQDILPYRNALAVYRYALHPEDRDRFQEAEILVAHWVIRDGKTLAGYPRIPGQVYRMTIEDMALHPEWEGERLIRDMDAWDLPLYVDVSG